MPNTIQYDLRLTNTGKTTSQLDIGRQGNLLLNLKDLILYSTALSVFGHSLIRLTKAQQRQIQIHPESFKAGESDALFTFNAQPLSSFQIPLDLFKAKEGIQNKTPMGLLMENINKALSADYDELDIQFLKKVEDLKKLLNSNYESLIFSNRGSQKEVEVNKEFLKPISEKISEVSKSKETNTEVSVTGILDELKFSKSNLVIKAENGNIVVHVKQEQLLVLKDKLGQRVSLKGIPSYRLNGELGFVDIVRVIENERIGRLLSGKPNNTSIKEQIALGFLKPKSKARFTEFLGTWPGDETDEEWKEMLKEL